MLRPCLRLDVQWELASTHTHPRSPKNVTIVYQEEQGQSNVLSEAKSTHTKASSSCCKCKLRYQTNYRIYTFLGVPTKPRNVLSGNVGNPWNPNHDGFDRFDPIISWIATIETPGSLNSWPWRSGPSFDGGQRSHWTETFLDHHIWVATKVLVDIPGASQAEIPPRTRLMLLKWCWFWAGGH